MKSIPSSHHLLPGLACLVLAMAGISCQSSTPPAADVSRTRTRSHWVKVSSQPPTYYPRGVPADAPTDHRGGEWVDTGDEHGTRYFIPLHGLGGMDRQMLVHEALAARSDKKLQEVAEENRQLRNKRLRYSMILVPMNVVGSIGGACIDEAQLESLAGEFKEQWSDESASTLAF